MKNAITYGDFQKLDLRIAGIQQAERIEGSEKLVRLQVDLGSEIGTRQLLAGIGKRYAPEELIGRNIVVVVNLEPKKMMGEESQGMLLAASTEEGPALLTAFEKVDPGAEVR
ncbi:MAG: methionine--tRNA ligase subunit beta [Patescibacteria group bacterium]